MSSLTADVAAQPPDRSKAALAWTLLVVSVGSTVFGVGFSVATSRGSDVEALSVGWSDLVFVLAFLLFPVVGVLVASRRPENSVGWLLLGVGVLHGLSLAQGAYSTWTIYATPGAPRGTALAAAMAWTWIPVVAVPAVFLPLLFPDGHLPSPRWRWFAWVLALGMVAASIGIAFTSGPLEEFPEVENPIAVPGLEVLTLGLLVLPIGVVGAVISLILRYRRAQADERQQIRWVAAAAAVMGVAYTAALVATWTTDSAWNGTAPGWVQVLQTGCLAAFGLIPAAMGVAILHYHLYDLGLVIRKTVIFAAVAAFIALVYVGVVAGVGALVGSRSSPLVSAIAAAAVALVFQPVRAWARRLADRVVYGKRATPYEVMATFGEQLAGTYATDDVLPRTARVLGEGVGAVRAEVRLAVGEEMRTVASWPAGAPAASDDYVADVRHQGELLGTLAVSLAANDPLDATREQLVQDLASQAGLVLRNERLTAQLRAHLADLQGAQRRLVAAQDQERRKLERNIHDGAQQQLVALQVRQRLAEQLVDRDPSRAKAMLADLQADTATALDDLRDLARGIYPPLLADRGLAAALDAQARRAPLPVTVAADGVGRLPQAVEAAVYFSALEALQNTAKYAEAAEASITLERTAAGVAFSVSDDGRGFDAAAVHFGTGLQGIADRLGALDGSIAVESAPGKGTTVRGTVPVALDAMSDVEAVHVR